MEPDLRVSTKYVSSKQWICNFHFQIVLSTILRIERPYLCLMGVVISHLPTSSNRWDASRLNHNTIGLLLLSMSPSRVWFAGVALQTSLTQQTRCPARVPDMYFCPCTFCLFFCNNVGTNTDMTVFDDMTPL
jgi:hypothetical protein